MTVPYNYYYAQASSDYPRVHSYLSLSIMRQQDSTYLFSFGSISWVMLHKSLSCLPTTCPCNRRAIYRVDFERKTQTPCRTVTNHPIENMLNLVLNIKRFNEFKGHFSPFRSNCYLERKTNTWMDAHFCSQGCVCEKKLLCMSCKHETKRWSTTSSSKQQHWLLVQSL